MLALKTFKINRVLTSHENGKDLTVRTPEPKLQVLKANYSIRPGENNVIQITNAKNLWLRHSKGIVHSGKHSFQPIPVDDA